MAQVFSKVIQEFEFIFEKMGITNLDTQKVEILYRITFYYEKQPYNIRMKSDDSSNWHITPIEGVPEVILNLEPQLDVAIKKNIQSER